ncbi:MAG: bifunctional protein-serine/threonine kinase/phosphatase [Hyphomicrobiaceae bacterium]|nr:bifunctional protein-serine/threonine kinase/phosphatase [Hyphomicrobiaceae bacterium]
MNRHVPASDRLSVSIGQFSSAGVKASNQDFHGALLPRGEGLTFKGITLAIADGISTSSVSGEAAETAVKSFLTDYYATPDAWSVRRSATNVIAATNTWLHSRNLSLGDMNKGRVCTFSALILKAREAHVLHVGDSRIQRFQNGVLEALTEDHRLILSPEENYLGRALGAERRVDIDYKNVSLERGDIFLLTTDGVHEHVDAATIRKALASGDLDAAARNIAGEALERGSTDNLTIQIVRIESLPENGDALALDRAELPIPSLPKAGDILDGYRIVRPVQTTARSHVFLATASDGRKVALKIPASETAADESYLKRFVLEEWIAGRVSSPHVLAAEPADRSRSALYVVTEWVEGVTLRQWMTDHPRATLNEVRKIVAQVIEGLRALHRRDMIHQDLRPENVMIDDDGTIKIIDLGSASVAGVEEAAPGMLGAMPGTFQYTAPEYLSGDHVSWRSDQYALGVMAYEMLTGRIPYGAQVARIRSRSDQRKLVYEPARDDDSGVPDWMDAALRRAVNPDPVMRYDALSEFLMDLQRPGPTWSSTRHVPLAQRSPVRFWQSVSGILALICLVLAMQLVK